MSSDVIYSFAIGFVGAILFLLVDKHEPDGPKRPVPERTQRKTHRHAIHAECSAGVNCRASVVMRNERGGEVLGHCDQGFLTTVQTEALAHGRGGVVFLLPVKGDLHVLVAVAGFVANLEE
jgi:hypothetical protein